ncbi:helix-turn-helix domain-containing protein [Massilia sp. CFBP9012]|uniref:helix-turn-helix domain-containing protein n=1 Tax=Massilia sp. CFBP9012 TaxID=3096531 RepID=UPI002A6AA48C|nr:helix-turn-helix domain-containing protein [Massilia sp. CFBP9012]MDY0976815.1 helix-turn-helix domain-containing protein [Massilia sp. CFBP9012]
MVRQSSPISHAVAPPRVVSRAIARDSRLYEVMDLMLDSVGDPLALGSLAASASYSSYHFDRIFRELTGFSAVEYQRKRRLRRAAHLLRHEPDVPVGRIAQDCGFPSNAAFSKAFRQQFAMSAKEWRDGGWRAYMDAQVGRESDVSFFVAEPSNLAALQAPYCPPEPGSVAGRVTVRSLPAVNLRYQRFFGQSGAALSLACNAFICERERTGLAHGASWYGVFDEDPGFTGEREYCYDFGLGAEAPDDDPTLGLRVLPAGSYACLDFDGDWPRFRAMYEDWLERQAVWRLDATRPHIQKVERDGAGGWRGWLALPVKKR